MNDDYPRMKNFFYWHRPNIILSIPIYEYVLICIAIISVYHSLSNLYRMFCHDYTLVFNDALKKTSACMSRRS